MRFLILASLLFCSIFAQAQDDPTRDELAPCGTPPGISPWLLEYASRPEDFAALRSSDTLYAGMQVHLLARNDGTGRLSPERLLDAFCRLNTDLGPARVRFFFKNEWNLINNTAWHQHPELTTGIEMMLANDVPDAQNTYFVSNPAGNAGYNLPYAGVAMSHGSTNATAHVWAHEIGHAFSLQHTFLGWEGKVYNMANPTPTFVTYDYTHFHDTIDTQIPAPLDTALVEYVDGSNCAIAADLICDTKPDYLSYGWGCDGQGQSLVQQKDPSGATFYSDGTLFLTYSVDDCQSRFSDEQITVLRANLLTEHAAWLDPGPPEADITEPTELLSPTGGQLSPALGTVLQWTSVPHATRYLVQVSRFSTFIAKELDLVTGDTSHVLGQLLPNQNYYWRARPFNDWYTCTEWTATGTFKAAEVSNTNEPDADGWRCFPTLLVQGQPITVEWPENWLGKSARCIMFDAAGRVMWTEEWTPASLKEQFQLPITNWPSGVYRLVFLHEKGHKSQSAILAN
jgi:hypothetical protein